MRERKREREGEREGRGRGRERGEKERGREGKREREGGREGGRGRERVLTSFSKPSLQHPSENYKACPSICIETVAHHTCDKLSEEREWALH